MRPAKGEREAREAIVLVCRRLYERGLIAGPDGNVSVRISDSLLLVTPAGLSKADVREPDLVLVRPDGTHVAGARRASSELRMHLLIYDQRKDVTAVVHAHPPIATGMAVAGEDMLEPVLPEVVLQTGGIPLIPYATPGSAELANAFAPFLPHHDAFLMANHGATTVGASLTQAHQRMESLEHAARILLAARLYGRVTPLTGAQARALLELRGVVSKQPPRGREGGGTRGSRDST